MSFRILGALEAEGPSGSAVALGPPKQRALLAILLLHVGASAAGDFEALPGLIQFFRDSGYAFVTIEQMLQP